MVRHKYARAAAKHGMQKTMMMMEPALLAGGALSATGLYVSGVALRGTYRGLRRLVELATPGHAPTAYAVAVDGGARGAEAEGQMLLARDTALGGALLLAPRGGLFYLNAPEHTVWELRHGDPAAATRTLHLPPHAYFLYHYARSFDTAAGHANDAHRAFIARRAEGFAADCLLHMLLNDAFHYAAWLQHDNNRTPMAEGLRAAWRALIDRLLPGAPPRAGWLFAMTTRAAAPRGHPAAVDVLQAWLKDHPRFLAEWRRAMTTMASRASSFFYAAAAGADDDDRALVTLGHDLDAGVDGLRVWLQAPPAAPAAAPALQLTGPATCVGRLAYAVVLNGDGGNNNGASRHWSRRFLGGA